MFNRKPVRCREWLAFALALTTLGTGVALGQTAAPSNSLRYADQQVRLPQAAPAPRRPAAAEPAATVFVPKGGVRQTASSSRQASPEPAKVSTKPNRVASVPAKVSSGPMDAVNRGGSPSPTNRVEQASYPQPRVVRPGRPVRNIGGGCDCDECVSGQSHFGEAACGVEPRGRLFGRCANPNCFDPGCGVETSCGFEADCGFEPDCGFENVGCDGYGCASGSCSDCVDLCLPVARFDWRRWEFFGGVNGFTGPANHPMVDGARSGSSSFGFYEGFNFGRSLNRVLPLDVSGQFGLRATQSSLSGAAFTEESRQQLFLTGGFFRRVDFGLQFGAVVDYQHDDWWYTSDLAQVRGELSWNNAAGYEFGYQFMIGTNSSVSDGMLRDGNTSITGLAAFEATSQHRLFLRGNTQTGGDYAVFAGGTERGDGLLGGTLTSAFRGRFAAQIGATYLIPAESRQAFGYAEEGWNMSMGIVFRPGGKSGGGRYARPMFDVADNGTFLVDRL